ncbi:MAG: hypothetical protein MUC76_04675 [Spirochaetes bacterium]|jgi:hypothetical protein|nr:hypothetical protein [Spirochaetota bacterium]
MNGEENNVVDFTTIMKLKEVESSLKKEIQESRRELIELMNKKEEYIAHLVRVLLAKIDSMESANGSPARIVSAKAQKKSVKEGGFFGARRRSWGGLL